MISIEKKLLIIFFSNRQLKTVKIIHGEENSGLNKIYGYSADTVKTEFGNFSIASN